MNLPNCIYVKVFNNTVTKAVYNEDKKGYEILDAYDAYLGSFADMTCKENFNKFKDFEAGEAFTSLVFKEPNSDSSYTFEYFVFLDPQLAFKPTYTL